MMMMNTASCCISCVRSTGYFIPLVAFTSDDEITLAGCAVFTTGIYKRSASCSYAPCYHMCPHPLSLASNDRTALVNQQCLWLTTADRRTTTGTGTDRAVSPGLFIATLASRYRVLLSPYLYLEVMPEFHL